MNEIKKPYEISVWKDLLMYVGTPVEGKTSPTSNISDLTHVDYQYYTEERLAIIGSDTMTSPMRAVNPVLKRNINGVESLSFDMYYQYEDIETGEIVRNPLIDLVIDERKVKLKYDGVWYDFIVKKDDEKGREYKYSYTCNGLAANELGKTGFSIELDTELENNMGTVQQLAAQVLKDSDWQLAGTGQDIIQQTNEEALYIAFTNTQLTANKIHGGDAVTIPASSRIYIYYTPYVNQETDFFQFIYVDEDTGTKVPDLKEDGYTIDCNDTRTFDLYLSNVVWDNGAPQFSYKAVDNMTEAKFNANKTYYYRYSDSHYVQCTVDEEYDSLATYYIKTESIAQYRGLRYVRKQLSAYDPVLEQPVLKYTRNEGGEEKVYYGYTTTEYLDTTSVQNFIYNSTNFSGTSYWGIYGFDTSKSIAARVFPDVKTNNTSMQRAGYLDVQFGSAGTRLMNDGIVQNYSRIDKFNIGDMFRLKICLGTVNTENQTFTPCSTLPVDCVIKQYVLIDQDSPNDKIYFDSRQLTSFDSEGDYLIADMTCLKSATWRDLNKNVGIYFILKATYEEVEVTEEEFNSNKTNYYYLDGGTYVHCTSESNYDSNLTYYIDSTSTTEFYIKDVQWYKYIVGDDNEPLEPGDVPEVRIETAYHFYDPALNGNRMSEEDYEFSESDPSLYTPMYGEGDEEFEKVRSITEKESNRFNLLQTLSETFECWVRFDIEHETGIGGDGVDGRIRIEDFTYYNPLNLKEGDPAYGTYIYNWATQEYEEQTDEEAKADGIHTYYEDVQRKRQVKHVTFYKERLVDNYAGFKYGINLNSNNRTLDSEQIVTKIIVKNNSCDQAENGFCSIARAKDNPIKENFAYNFDYYTSQGIINLSTLNNDLYLQINGSIGLYPRLARLNKQRNELIDAAAPLANSIDDLSSKYQVAALMYNEAEKDLQRMLDPQSGTIVQYTKFVYADFYNQVGRTEDNTDIPSYPETIYYIESGNDNLGIAADAGTIKYYKVTEDTTPQQDKTYYYISSSKFTELRSTKFSTTSVYYEEFDPSAIVEEEPSNDEPTPQKFDNVYFQTDEDISTLTFTNTTDTDEIYVYNAARRRMDDLGAEDFINDNFTISTLEKIVTQQANSDTAKIDMDKYEADLNETQAKYDAIQDQLKEIARATNEVEKEFNIKYSRYVQEGSWTDDNYIDDDLYYLDSLAVLYQSAYPKVSYNFGVLDLSQLEGYELYKFDIGNKTFVEDTEFFGYKLIDGLRTPVREQVVVTEATIYIEEPDKNQLKVQNYKSHFEDLFQRITAATQSLEYHSGEYGRAASAVTPDGQIASTVMQKSLATSSYVIQNSYDQSVVWDETGISATNLSDPAQITRLSSAGIIISSDGGNTWSVAIAGNGINTSNLTAGNIDADRINILSGASPTFKWDALGLRAYGFNLDDSGNLLNYDPAKYIVYDKYGIYGVDGLTDAKFTSIKDIRESQNTVFGLTWDGLFIKSTHRDGYVSISSDDDITLREYYTPITRSAQPQRAERVRGKFGLLSDGDHNTENKDIYGLALYDENEELTVTTQSTGTLWLKSQMDIGDKDSNSIYIGVGQYATQDEQTKYGSSHGKKVFTVHGEQDTESSSGGDTNVDRFSVFEDGFVVSQGNYIEGPLIVTAGGQIGNMSVVGLVDTVGIRIVPGNTEFKYDGVTPTPASMVFTTTSAFSSGTYQWYLYNSLADIDSHPISQATSSNYTYSFSSSDYLNGIAYLKVKLTIGTDVYSDVITLSYVIDGQAGPPGPAGESAGQFIIRTNGEDILKFTDRDRLTDELFYTFSANQLVLYGFDQQNLNTLANKEIYSEAGIVTQEEFNSNKSKYYIYDGSVYVNCRDSTYDPLATYYIKEYYCDFDVALNSWFLGDIISPSYYSKYFHTNAGDNTNFFFELKALYDDLNTIEENYVVTEDTKFIDGKTYYYKDGDNYIAYTTLPIFDPAEDYYELKLCSPLYNEMMVMYDITSDEAPLHDKTYYYTQDSIHYIKCVDTTDNYIFLIVSDLTEEQFNQSKILYYYKVNDDYIHCKETDTFDNNKDYYIRLFKYVYVEVDITAEDYAGNESNYYYYDDGQYIQCTSQNPYDSSRTYYTRQNYNTDKNSVYYEKLTQTLIDNISNFYNDPSSGDIYILGYTVVTDHDDDDFNMEKHVMLRNGLSTEMMEFDVNAGNISAAIRNTGLEFDTTGLTITNGGFQIDRQEEGKDVEHIFYIDENTKQLVMNGTGSFTGDIYANNGRFSGEIQALTGSIGGFNINSNSIYSKDMRQGVRNLVMCSGDPYYVSVQIDSATYTGHESDYYYINNNGQYTPCLSYNIAQDLTEEQYTGHETDYYYISEDEYVQCTSEDPFDSNITYYTKFIKPYSIDTVFYIVNQNRKYNGDSYIEVTNINIGTGAEVGGEIKVGNLKISNPIVNNNKVISLADGGTEYFTLMNDGSVIGDGWSIQKNVSGETTATFNHGKFYGFIDADSGRFTGEITAGVINASTINTTNFITQYTRAMGGSFIFKPTFDIISITDLEEQNRLKFELSKESKDYFNLFQSNDLKQNFQEVTENGITYLITGSYVQVNANEKYIPEFTVDSSVEPPIIGKILTYDKNRTLIDDSTNLVTNTEFTIAANVCYIKLKLQATNLTITTLSSFILKRSTKQLVTISGFDSRFGEIIGINKENENCEVTVQFSPTDYSVLAASNALSRYQTLTLFGFEYRDTLIGINSDDYSAGNMLPQRSLVMKTFGNLASTQGGSGVVSSSLNLLLGDLSSISNLTSFGHLNGYGLYADNVYLHGSIVTESGTSNSYAGVHTAKDLDFNYQMWSDSTSSDYQNEKIIFWGGAEDLSDEKIRKSPFIVTDKGSIFASRGEFKGTVITNSLISHSIIETPVISGTGTAPSLKIYETNIDSSQNGGIGFYHKVGNIDQSSGETNDQQILLISSSGFRYTFHNGNNAAIKDFIQFSTTDNNVIFNGSILNAGSTQITTSQISNGSSLITFGTGNMEISYDRSKIKLEKTSSGTAIYNYGGKVMNEGNMQLFDSYVNNGRTVPVKLDYKLNNGYYCLYVE